MTNAFLHRSVQIIVHAELLELLLSPPGAVRVWDLPRTIEQAHTIS